MSHLASIPSDVLLGNSPLRTFYFQQSMPKLPLPALDATLDGYTAATQPVLAKDVHKSLLQDISAFRTGSGRTVQAALAEWDRTHPETSFISDLWFDLYLRDRSALPLNLNPQLTWRGHTNPAKNEQCTRAADLLCSSARFLLTLEAEALPPDVYWALAKPLARKPSVQSLLGALVPERYGYYPFYLLQAYPLDMSQMAHPNGGRLFRSTRLPRPQLDVLWTAPARTRHVVVMAGTKTYKLDVLQQDSNAPYDVEVIESGLRAILTDSATSSTDGNEGELPVAALTTADRDVWAAARSQLEKASPMAAATLAEIDSALFVLTLDPSTPVSHEDISRTMLHGDGRSRWFDKCFNLIVTQNGVAGINWEHAWGDGIAVLLYFNTVYEAMSSMRDRTKCAVPSHLSAAGPSNPRRLLWDIQSVPGMAETIRAAEASFDAAVSGTDLRVYQTPSLTAADVKRSKLSPDGVMQMALQIAHRRTHGYTPSTYESASTAGFKHGRTETIRSASIEAAQMCDVFGKASGAVSQEAQLTRFRALAAATSRHSKLARDAALGRGVDRHLFALQAWAAKLGLPASLFTHPGHLIFRDIRLSTSTLASPALEGGGFGPVSPSAYSVGYGIEERGAHFHVMVHRGGGVDADAAQPSRVPHSHPHCDAEGFTDAVEGALGDIRECMAAAAKVEEVGVTAQPEGRQRR